MNDDENGNKRKWHYLCKMYMYVCMRSWQWWWHCRPLFEISESAVISLVPHAWVGTGIHPHPQLL